MNKKFLLGLIGVFSLSASLNLPLQVSAADESADTTSQTTADNNAAVTSPITDENKPASSDNTNANSSSNSAIEYLNRNVKLKQNSYIYNKKGKKTNKKALKKNTIVTVTGYTNVKGKEFLQINNKKNQFIKANNVKTFKAAGYKVKKKSYVYNSKGVQQKGLYVAKGKFVPVIKVKTIKGKKYVGITETQYIKWANLNHKSGKVISQ
ncbi:SLAP domain-containing protein [Lactobacillus sp. ESL0684]|uniref:SLAP domain-containing protein n=1 Tax=unclassified Lactobacillus TaxID=2620435 RepID=UPI0023F95321|nr:MULTISPECIES: SLAP domain-containing protein [unclassified Lactobacillus]WEV40771.1 SLAP domain-containing protein [Lactobacillus sp. ESL0681]WEV44401.1 SLAP domain-containing protein [Lactobacillus sp. ESL0684]